MSGVGAAILEPQEHAQSESVRVYLSQSILPAITEALTAMEKERCPNPVPHPCRTRLQHCLTSTRALLRSPPERPAIWLADKLAELRSQKS